MRIDILTIFPGMFTGVFGESIIKRARERKIAEINIHDIRTFSEDKHKTVDDYPYGGGAGMVLKVQPIHSALEYVTKLFDEKPFVCLMCPRGKVFNQKIAVELSKKKNLILIAGHYEGYDERIRAFCDMELSIGDYILTGGELPAMVVTDAIVRLQPGALGDEMSAIDESFSEYLLEYPQYTRPRSYLGFEVPEVLLSGHHAEINRWRRKEALKITLKNRPDLLGKNVIQPEDLKLLKEIASEIESEN